MSKKRNNCCLVPVKTSSRERNKVTFRAIDTTPIVKPVVEGKKVIESTTKTATNQAEKLAGFVTESVKKVAPTQEDVVKMLQDISSNVRNTPQFVYQTFIGDPIARVQKQYSETKNRFAEAIGTQYKLCDSGLPKVVTICDNFTSGSIWVKILGYILIALVLFFDIFGDIITYIVDILAGVGSGIPIFGGVIGFISQQGFDDVIDLLSAGIVFIWCGPLVSIPAVIAEIPDSLFELAPWWTVMILVYFIYIRQIRVEQWASKGVQQMALGLLRPQKKQVKTINRS